MSPRTRIVLVPDFHVVFVTSPAPFTITSKGEVSTLPTAVSRSEPRELLARSRERLRLLDSPWRERSAPAGRSASTGRTFATLGGSTVTRGARSPLAALDRLARTPGRLAVVVGCVVVVALAVAAAPT